MNKFRRRRLTKPKFITRYGKPEVGEVNFRGLKCHGQCSTLIIYECRKGVSVRF